MIDRRIAGAPTGLTSMMPVGIVAGLDDVAMLRQAIEQRRGHLAVAERAGPLTEGQVGRGHRWYRRGVITEGLSKLKGLQVIINGEYKRRIEELQEQARIDMPLHPPLVPKSDGDPESKKPPREQRLSA